MNRSRHEFSSAGELASALEEIHQTPDDFCLEGDHEDTWIIVSFDPGSQRYYVSTCLPGDTDYMEVYDPARPHNQIEAVIGGQLIDLWDDSLVSFEAAKSACTHFFKHESRDPLLKWRVAKLTG